MQLLALDRSDISQVSSLLVVFICVTVGLPVAVVELGLRMEPLLPLTLLILIERLISLSRRIQNGSVKRTHFKV